MDKDRHPKKRPGEPVWEDCETHNLNEKPGESPIETVKRILPKIDHVHGLKEKDQEGNWDADTAIASATSSHARAIDAIEKDYERGRKIVDAAKQGHEAVYGTVEEKQTRWKMMLDTCLDVYKEHPNWGLTSIRQETAGRLKVGISTVERQTRTLQDEINKLK